MSPAPSMSDDELWHTVLDRVRAGAIRPEFASDYWFKELRAALDHAEANLDIQNAQAVVRAFRELQARCETIIGVLAPEEKGVPRLVVAA
jgi:alpha-D-ribose 1-methylphosphonate 5-triphosphate synthase subunit PhnL